MTARTKFMVGMAGAAVLVVLIGSASAVGQGTKPAAIVNGEAISFQEVEDVVKLLPAPPGLPSEIQKRQMRREAVQALIEDVLMRQFLKKNGNAVAPAEINKKMAELENALKGQNRTMQDFLKETAQTEAHLRQDIQKKIQWDAYVKVYLTEDNLRRYYEENKEFYDQVTVKASHILMRLPPNAPEDQCQNARTKLLDLRQKLLTGQLDFAEAAKKYSECTTAPQGGDIGYFPRKWAVDENIARAAFVLKPGEISDVVRTDIGFHLIKVTDRRPGQPSTYDRVKNDVRENLATELWEHVLTQQRQAAHLEVNVP